MINERTNSSSLMSPAPRVTIPNHFHRMQDHILLQVLVYCIHLHQPRHQWLMLSPMVKEQQQQQPMDR